MHVVCCIPIPNIGNQDGLHYIFGLLHAKSIPKKVTSGAMLTALVPACLDWKAAPGTRANACVLPSRERKRTEIPVC